VGKRSPVDNDAVTEPAKSHRGLHGIGTPRPMLALATSVRRQVSWLTGLDPLRLPGTGRWKTICVGNTALKTASKCSFTTR